MKNYTLKVGEVFTDQKRKELQEYLELKDKEIEQYKEQKNNIIKMIKELPRSDDSRAYQAGEENTISRILNKLTT